MKEMYHTLQAPLGEVRGVHTHGHHHTSQQTNTRAQYEARWQILSHRGLGKTFTDFSISQLLLVFLQLDLRSQFRGCQAKVILVLLAHTIRVDKTGGPANPHPAIMAHITDDSPFCWWVPILIIPLPVWSPHHFDSSLQLVNHLRTCSGCGFGGRGCSLHRSGHHLPLICLAFLVLHTSSEPDEGLRQTKKALIEHEREVHQLVLHCKHADGGHYEARGDERSNGVAFVCTLLQVVRLPIILCPGVA